MARRRVLGVTVLVAAAGVTAWFMLPRAQLALVGLVLLVVLAYVGRPKDRPAFAPGDRQDAVPASDRGHGRERARRGRLGASWTRKAATRCVGSSPCQRDGAGYLAVIDLPPGTTFAQAMEARASIASGLHVLHRAGLAGTRSRHPSAGCGCGSATRP